MSVSVHYRLPQNKCIPIPFCPRARVEFRLSPASQRAVAWGVGQPKVRALCCSRGAAGASPIPSGSGVGPASSVLCHSHPSRGQCHAVPELISLSEYGVLSFCLSWLSGLSPCLAELLGVVLSFP